MPDTTSVPITTRGFSLAPWQLAALAAWQRGDGLLPYRGTLEIFTGGGKTLIALEAAAEVSHGTPELKIAVVVPTQALAEQWAAAIARHTNLASREIGILGGGKKGSFQKHRVVVAVLNTASKRLPTMAATAQPLMLIVDEAHRAGAKTFSGVLRTPAAFRLGLSATPDREEIDEDGEPIAFDEQLVGRSLGRVVFRFSLKEAREAGWLPAFEIHHHGVRLTEDERRRYDEISRRVDDLADRLRAAGLAPERAMRMHPNRDDLLQMVTAYVGATSQRKDFLYRATERARVTTSLVTTIMSLSDRRILLFGERVTEAESIASSLRKGLGDEQVAIEHAELRPSERRQALDDFREGRKSVLVSVKALVEGIDVPEADVGIAVASSAAVRQRIQSLGRILRRRFDDVEKHAEMHVIYVNDTVDDLIYSKEDWSDLTGEGNNHYWLWPLDPTLPPELQSGPPRTPKPTEQQEWERLQRENHDLPTLWFGLPSGQEYSVDTLGTVTNQSNTTIGNPQGVAEMVSSVRGKSGGRFRVTPQYRAVLVRADGGEDLWLAGWLKEPFTAREEQHLADFDIAQLRPGDPYPGPTDEINGSFRVSQRNRGTLERELRTTTSRGKEFATESGQGSRATNARAVLDAWRASGVGKGLLVRCNSLWDAYYVVGGQPLFLARIPEGLAWPSESDEREETPSPL
ncbi:MAG: DEAD/DEAH box helicase [Chloroflexi bacterium]|nr:DEAD/DEAH box helicase [Chloroflexota bacterium]